MQNYIRRLAVLAGLSMMGASAGAGAQQVADPGFKSVGRGAPLAADLRKYEIVGPSLRGFFAPPPNVPIPLDPSDLAKGRGAPLPGAAAPGGAAAGAPTGVAARMRAISAFRCVMYQTTPMAKTRPAILTATREVIVGRS